MPVRETDKNEWKQKTEKWMIKNIVEIVAARAHTHHRNKPLCAYAERNEPIFGFLLTKEKDRYDQTAIFLATGL